MKGQLVRVQKVSDGNRRCLMCRRVIPKGESYEEQGTTNEKGRIEYWVNVCLSDVVKQVDYRLARAA